MMEDNPSGKPLMDSASSAPAMRVGVAAQARTSSEGELQ
jgi:hypothetical protein